MTCIVNYATKKAFKQAVAFDASTVEVEDPSFVDPYISTLKLIPASKFPIYVTNHPKRSWFAEVKRVLDSNGLVTYKVL